MTTVVIGCDPHKTSVTCAVMSAGRELIGSSVFATDEAGWRQLRKFSERWPDRRFAVEGAHGTGRSLAQRLLAADESVVDVPAKLAARVRVLSTGHGRKTDHADALAVATAAIDHPKLYPVVPEGHISELRLLVERRRDLVAERTRCVNRLHGLLAELAPGGSTPNLTAARAAAVLRRCRRAEGATAIRQRLCRDLLGDLRHLDHRLATLDTDIAASVRTQPTELTTLFGVGPILAAKIIANSGPVNRFADRNHYASYTGTAPIDASSGEITRRRLSRAGNRQLNHVLHLVAICQIRHDTDGRLYYQRKIGEGKTRREALRCLKRRLSDAVFRALQHDFLAANAAT